MNIFAVDKCPTKSARALPDKLIVKMPLETAQMLSTAHRLLSPIDYCEHHNIYKPAYVNHPCTIWARATHENYRWLYEHFIALGTEYKYRYGREHASIIKLAKPFIWLPENIKTGAITPFAQAMPDKYKNDDHVLAYRQYMMHEKHYAKWEKGVDKPKWWII